MRPLIISDTGLIMVLSLQSFIGVVVATCVVLSISWWCHYFGFLTTPILLTAYEQFKHNRFTSKGLYLFVNVIKGREHDGLFKITIIAATILVINITSKAFSIDIIIIINNQQVEKISLSFFRKKCGKYDCPNLQKLLVSIFSIKWEITKKCKSHYELNHLQ